MQKDPSTLRSLPASSRLCFNYFRTTEA
jgi:hypothetical protein